MSEGKFGKDELKEQSIADLLALDLNEIADAVGFVLPPKGAYTLGIAKCELGSVGNGDNAKEAINMDFTVEATLELEKESDVPVENGSQFSMAYMGGASVQYFKTHFKEAAVGLGATNVGDLISKLGTGGVKISCTIGHRSDKRDPEDIKYYPQLDNITLV